MYEYDEDKSLNIKEFNMLSDECLDFIINCRNGVKHDYDIVVGAMADDQIYNYVSDLIMKIHLTYMSAIKGVRFYKEILVFYLI